MSVARFSWRNIISSKEVVTCESEINLNFLSGFWLFSLDKNLKMTEEEAVSVTFNVFRNFKYFNCHFDVKIMIGRYVSLKII